MDHKLHEDKAWTLAGAQGSMHKALTLSLKGSGHREEGPVPAGQVQSQRLGYEKSGQPRPSHIGLQPNTEVVPTAGPPSQRRCPWGLCARALPPTRSLVSQPRPAQAFSPELLSSRQQPTREQGRGGQVCPALCCRARGGRAPPQGLWAQAASAPRSSPKAPAGWLPYTTLGPAKEGFHRAWKEDPWSLALADSAPCLAPCGSPLPVNLEKGTEIKLGWAPDSDLGCG